MRTKNPNWLKFAILAVVIALVLVLIGSYSIISTKTDVDLQNRQYLSGLAEQNTNLIRSKINSELDKMESLANIIGSGEEFSNEFALEILHAESFRTTLKRLAYVPLDGEAVTTDNAKLNVLGREYFNKALAGESNVSDRIVDKVDGGFINVYAVPVYHKGKIMGAVIATFDTGALSAVLNVNTFYDEGFSYIVKKDGSMVVYGRYQNSFLEFDDLFEEIYRYGADEADILSMQANMEHNENGIFEYRSEYKDWIAAYQKVDINDWYIVSVAPKVVIYESANRLIYRNVVNVIVTVLLFVILIGVLIIQNQKSRQKLSQLAFTDPLTGGNNLNKFKMLASTAIKENKNSLYMVRIDIDNFQLINDMYGYNEGDEVLMDMNRLISEILSSKDIYGRSGSDNFICLLKGDTDEVVIEKGAAFRSAYRQNLISKGKRYIVNFTTGIYKITPEEMDIDKIIDRATMAHRRAKQLPYERKYFFYSETIRNMAIRTKDIENKMHDALTSGEFTVYFQPKYNLNTGKMEGAEALIRWIKDGTMLSPAEFLPVFEQNGFIVNIDLYVLEEVCRLQRTWLDAGIKSVPVSVNQSKPLVYGEDYVENLYDTIKQYRLPPYYIELELLENLIHENIIKLSKITDEMRELGFLICIDDFGSGYSSLNLLKDIRADVLKIDKEFLNNAESNQRAEIILSNVIRLAEELAMEVVVEGVETEKQVEMLIKLGCSTAQGYLYAKPMPAKDFEKLLRKETKKL